MDVEIVVKIDPERIRAEDRETRIRAELPNCVVVDKKNGRRLGLGEDLDAVRSRLGDRTSAYDMAALTLFGPDGDQLSRETQLLNRLVGRLARESPSERKPILEASNPSKSFDLLLELPGYETFSRERRRIFEHAIQAHLHVRRLTINGQELAIPAKKRELEIRLWRLFGTELPIAALIVGGAVAPAVVRAHPLAVVAYFLLIFLVFHVAGRFAWLHAARRLIPVHYCIYVLVVIRGRYLSWNRWLVRVVWHVKRAKRKAA